MSQQPSNRQLIRSTTTGPDYSGLYTRIDVYNDYNTNEQVTETVHFYRTAIVTENRSIIKGTAQHTRRMVRDEVIGRPFTHMSGVVPPPKIEYVEMEHPADLAAASSANTNNADLLETFRRFNEKRREREEERELQSYLEEAFRNDPELAALNRELGFDTPVGGTAGTSGASGAKSSAGYVPPALRRRMEMERELGGATGGGKAEEEDTSNSTTLKVMNLTYAHTEDFIRELFSRYGRVLSVRLSERIVRQNGQRHLEKAAFVQYSSRGDALAAIQAKNGRPCQSVILAIEWAKERKPMGGYSGGGGGGGYSSHRTGYGQKLAQEGRYSYSTL